VREAAERCAISKEGRYEKQLREARSK
jgi:hypothetical protein